MLRRTCCSLWKRRLMCCLFHAWDKQHLNSFSSKLGPVWDGACPCNLNRPPFAVAQEDRKGSDTTGKPREQNNKKHQGHTKGYQYAMPKHGIYIYIYIYQVHCLPQTDTIDIGFQKALSFCHKQLFSRFDIANLHHFQEPEHIFHSGRTISLAPENMQKCVGEFLLP